MEHERTEDGDLAGFHLDRDGARLIFEQGILASVYLAGFLLGFMRQHAALVGAGDDPDTAVGEIGIADGGPAGDVFEGHGLGVPGILVPFENLAELRRLDGGLVVVEVDFLADDLPARLQVDGRSGEFVGDLAQFVETAERPAALGRSYLFFIVSAGAYLPEMLGVDAVHFVRHGSKLVRLENDIGHEIACFAKLLDLLLAYQFIHRVGAHSLIFLEHQQPVIILTN